MTRHFDYLLHYITLYFLHYYDTHPEQSVREIVNYLCTFYFFFLVRLVLYMYMFYTRLWIKNDIIIITEVKSHQFQWLAGGYDMEIEHI